MTNSVVLSIDVEWFTHTPAYRSASGTVSKNDIGFDGLEYLLDLFDRYDANATFFVVSSIAESHPDLVKRIADDGHEIASHTHTHRTLTDLEDAEWQRELVTSREVLEDLTGDTVEGFRAPVFARPAGFFEAVRDAGYLYDSSVVPARSILGWYGGEYSVDQPVPASKLDEQYPKRVVELPISVFPRIRLPVSGAWVRLVGRWYCRTGIKWLHGHGITPILYVHPWEFVELPAVDGIPWRVYRHTGDWLRRTVESILDQDFEFRTASDLAAETALDDR